MLFHETGMPASINVYGLMMDTATYKGQLFVPKKDKDHTVFQMKNCWGYTTAKIRRDITSPAPTSEFNIEAAKDCT